MSNYFTGTSKVDAIAPPSNIVISVGDVDSSNGFFFFPAYSVQYRGYSYKLVGGTKYFSDTYTESNILSGLNLPERHVVNISFNISAGVDGYGFRLQYVPIWSDFNGWGYIVGGSGYFCSGSPSVGGIGRLTSAISPVWTSSYGNIDFYIADTQAIRLTAE